MDKMAVRAQKSTVATAQYYLEYGAKGDMPIQYFAAGVR